jgi:hypothetical protein
MRRMRRKMIPRIIWKWTARTQSRGRGCGAVGGERVCLSVRWRGGDAEGIQEVAAHSTALTKRQWCGGNSRERRRIGDFYNDQLNRVIFECERFKERRLFWQWWSSTATSSPLPPPHSASILSTICSLGLVVYAIIIICSCFLHLMSYLCQNIAQISKFKLCNFFVSGIWFASQCFNTLYAFPVCWIQLFQTMADLLEISYQSYYFLFFFLKLQST